MKINFVKDTIHIDFTVQSDKLANEIDISNKISIISDHYLIPVIKGLTKNSHSVGKFNVIPYSFSCTCKIYRQNIKLYQKRDLRRVCKHVFSVINSMYNDKLDDLTKMLLEHHFWFQINSIIEIKLGKENLFVSFSKARDFFFIYKKNSHWKSYKYFISTKTWENSIPPFKHISQNSFLEEFIKTQILYKSDIK